MGEWWLAPGDRTLEGRVELGGYRDGRGPGPLMSIVLSVHPGVQLDTRVDSKKSFCRSVMEGT